jgi:protein-disulfide isomerase-like protein with CxxC motif
MVCADDVRAEALRGRRRTSIAGTMNEIQRRELAAGRDLERVDELQDIGIDVSAVYRSYSSARDVNSEPSVPVIVG